MTDQKICCPACGNENSVYARADIRWQAATQSWEVAHIETELDCTECDHAWQMPDAWPQP